MFRSWPEDDQDEILGYLREQAKVCRCGTRREEWEADRNAYVVEIWTCPGCEQLDGVRKHLKDGQYAYLVPTAVAVALQEARDAE